MIWSGGGVVRPADFTFINRGEIGTLDPKGMSWLQDIRVAYALWEGLYSLDPQTLDAIPGAADRVELSPDRKIYTFHIRDTARWSNGDPVVAGDFVFAWKRALEEPQDYTYLMFYIQGAQEYSDQFLAGKRPDFGKVGVEAVGARQLKVVLKHPVTFFPDLCAFPPFFPLHEPSMRPFAEKPDPATGRVGYTQDFTRPPHLVGNGPYKLASWEFKRRLRLEASEFYWDRANVKSHVIEQISAADPQWAFLTYDSGAVDWLAEVTGDIAAELRQTGRMDLRVFPGFGTYFYSINCMPKLPDGQANPFADVRVRQAFLDDDRQADDRRHDHEDGRSPCADVRASGHLHRLQVAQGPAHGHPPRQATVGRGRLPGRPRLPACHAPVQQRRPARANRAVCASSMGGGVGRRRGPGGGGDQGLPQTPS